MNSLEIVSELKKNKPEYVEIRKLAIKIVGQVFKIESKKIVFANANSSNYNELEKDFDLFKQLLKDVELLPSESINISNDDLYGNIIFSLGSLSKQ